MSYAFEPLSGRGVRLEPLTERHREELRPAAQDERLWVHTLTNGFGPAFDGWFDDALADAAAGRKGVFAVRGLRDGAVLGSTAYLDLMPQHRRIEIGSTWYRSDVWGTAVNPECKFLLLHYAFETLHVGRVALVTDRLNLRSQAAITKLGAVREGVLRSHMIAQQGRVRDTVVFSIVAADWPQVRAELVARIDRLLASPA